MSAPSVTHTFANSTTADATQVNTNFTDIINAMTDGSADFTIGSLSVAGAATFNGAVTLGNATSDDITVTGSLASNLVIKTNATYGIGSSTSGLSGIYLGNGANKTTRIIAGTVGTSWTFTLPNDVPTITGQTFVFNTSGTAEFRYPDKFTASKTGDYTATGDETVIPCAPSASMTVTLPAASTCAGKALTIIKTDSDMTKVVTVDANSTELIDAAQTTTINQQYEKLLIVCNGTQWYILDRTWPTNWSSSTTMTINGVTSDPTKHTMTTDVVRWRRISQNMVEAEYQYLGTTAGSAGSGAYLWLLPGGLSADTDYITAYSTTDSSFNNKSTTSALLGCDGWWTAGDAGNRGNVYASLYDATRFKMGAELKFSNMGTLSSTYGSFFTTANTGLHIYVRFPVAGWDV